MQVLGAGPTTVNALATATLVNGGVQHRPHLGIATMDAVTREPRSIEQAPAVNLGYKPSHVDVIKRAMVAVTQCPARLCFPVLFPTPQKRSRHE